MDWTKEPPTKPGWYWCRDTDQRTPIHGGRPFVAEVGDGVFWATIYPGDNGFDEYPSLEWAGPLSPPEKNS